MINPKTYETLGMPLGLVGQILTEQILRALTGVHRQIILDPNSINQARRVYDAEVNKALKEWNKQWKAWADRDLATAYLRGTHHTDEFLKRMKIKRKPDGTISEIMPMAQHFRLVPPRNIPSQLKGMFRVAPNHLTFFNVFRRAAYHSLEGTTLQVMRSAQDLFRDTAVHAGSQLFRESDVFTRRQLSQTMLDEFAKQGIQSITYKNGRRMSIEAYSEMVGRTMSGHAAVQASLNRFEEYGYDLVRVSAHFRACPLCTPWEGRVLSQSGKSSKYPSLSDAVSAGLFHPNCAHDISPYFPGLSPDLEVRVDPAEQKLIDKHGYKKAQEIAYKAQEQQRYIERNIRNWKMRKVTALSDATKAQADQKVLEWQKAQRTHLAQNPFLPRKYEREAVKGYRQALSAAGTTLPQRTESEAEKIISAKRVVTKSWMNAVDEYINDTDLSEKLDYYKIPDLETYKKKCTERIKSFVEGQPVKIRVSEDVLNKVINDGRFKTQFETGASGGLLSNAIRADFENKVFGIPKDSTLGRPIYGYIHPGKFDTIDQYGKIIVELKDSVRQRTTFTVGDSLDSTSRGEEPLLSPQPLTEPSYLAARHLPQWGPLDWHNVSEVSSYIEAQIHGGVAVKDIERVVFRTNPDSATIANLKRANIEWVVNPKAR